MSRTDIDTDAVLTYSLCTLFALLAVGALVAGGAGTVAADHGDNHCEHHQSSSGTVSDVVDVGLDNLKQNLCEHGTTMDVAGMVGGNGDLEPE